MTLNGEMLKQNYRITRDLTQKAKMKKHQDPAIDELVNEIVEAKSKE